MMTVSLKQAVPEHVLLPANRANSSMLTYRLRSGAARKHTRLAVLIGRLKENSLLLSSI